MNAKDIETLEWIDTIDPTGEIEAASAYIAAMKDRRESLALFVASLTFAGREITGL